MGLNTEKAVKAEDFIVLNLSNILFSPIFLYLYSFAS